MHRQRFRALLVLLFAVVALTGYWQPAALDDLRNASFDLFQRLDPPAYDPASPVRILAIDEASLAALGQWPWPRTRFADLIDRLKAAGAAAIAFDMFFSEADRTSIDSVLHAMPDSPLRTDLMQRLASTESNDTVLARSLGAAPTVLGTVLRRKGEALTWPAKAGVAIAGDDPTPFIPDYGTALLPLPVLMEAAGGLGATNWLPDRDGVVRRVPLLVRSGTTMVPSLMIESLRVAQGASTYVLRGSNASGMTAFGANVGLNAIRVGDIEIATGRDGSIRPRYSRSSPQRFISAKDLLAGAVDPEEIRGRVIFVGTTAVGLGDVRTTPLDSGVPGVEIHAQVLEQLMSGRLLSRPDWAQGAECWLTVLCLAALTLALPRVPPLVGIVTLVATCAVLFAGAWVAFDRGAVLFDATFPSATLVLGYVATASMLWQTEQRTKRQVRTAFGKFVSPAVVARIAENPKLLVLSGETRDLTILFSDLRSFSTISEGLQAHEVAQFLNAYLTPMTDVILRHEGTVDKYIGDAIVAFWNAPLDVADHTRRAVDAALAMRAALAEFNLRQSELAQSGGAKVVLDVRMGVGLNFGPCSVGNMGSIQRFDYSALGDPVNVAARLEALTKAYGVDILATSSVVERLPDYGWFEVDEIKVKGRSAPTKLFGLAGGAETAGSAEFKTWIDRHARMLDRKRSGRSREAAGLAREIGDACAPAWRPLYDILARTYEEASVVAPDPAEIETLAHHEVL